MRWRFAAATFFAAWGGAAHALDQQSQRLADRYLAILGTNPSQEIAFQRLWKIYADSSETEALLAICRQRASENPVLYARVLQRIGREEDAKLILSETAERANNVVAAQMLAEMLESEGEVRAAAEVIQQAASKKEIPDLLVRLGELLQKAGELEGARGAWERAVALAPADLALRKRLATASAQAGDLQAAVGHLRVIAERGSPRERFDALGEMSLRLEEAGDLENAIASQEALLEMLGPGHWQLESVRHRLLNLHRQNQSLSRLEERWLKEEGARPLDPLLALRLAEFYEFQGDDRWQRDWLAKAADLLPKDIRLKTKLATLELSAGRPQAAADLYDKALAMRPDDGDLVFLRAEVSALLGEEADAEKRVEDYLAARKGDSAAEQRAIDFYRHMHLSGPLERRLSAIFSAHPGEEQSACDLARFYLEQGQDDKAVECLSRFEGTGSDSQSAAAVAFRFSEVLKGSGPKDEERRWVRVAFEKDPSRPDYALRLADLLQAEGATEAAIAVLRKACESAGASLPREDLDRRLFLALQSEERPPDEADRPAGRLVAETIAAMDRRAQETGDESAWLRLARWQRWTDSKLGPAAVLRRGLEALPQSAALQEALASQLAEAGDFPGSIEALGRLAALAPERRLEIQRRIGHLELDRGNAEEALHIFQSLAQGSHDWQMVSDLALAQQMSGSWFEAFETWQRAYGLAPPGSRRALRAPILNAATRLQLYPRAMDFLEGACAAEADAAARREIFGEAAAYAVEHGSADDWRTRMERQARTSRDGAPWREALASLLTAEGRLEEGRQALQASRKNKEDSVESIEPLIKSAEEAADWQEAARLARRLASLVGSQDPAPAMRHARFLERAGKRDESAAIWQALVARHARTPQVLSAAGDFFERTGADERAEAAYRAAARFRECPPQVRLRLGQFALEHGDRQQAMEDLEALLAQTRPEIDQYQDCIPLPERLLFSTPQPSRPGGPPLAHLKTPSETDNEGCRLLAIRETGRLLVHSPKKQTWSAGFSEPIEKLWAKYHSGDLDASFGEMERLASIDGGDPALEQSFAALAFEEQRDETLGRWANDSEKRQARWDNVLTALSRMLDTNWRPSSAFLGRAFSAAPALARWRASEFLAQRNLLAAACALGETVPDDLPASQACSAWAELARWWVAQGDPDEAITRLDRAIDCAPSAISFSEPLFAALRARWLLTPEDQRATFEEQVSLRLGKLKHRRCQSAAAALIASLNGNDSLAAGKIAEAVRDLGNSNDESWAELIQQGGNQLEEWNLHRLARDLYRADLAKDSALLSMRGENFQDSTTELLIINQLVSADRTRVPYLLNEWLSRGVSERKLLDASVRIQQAGRAETAAMLYQTLCERDPRNDGICAGILNLARIPLMRQHGISFLERLLAEESPEVGRAMIQMAGLRLAGILDEQGEYDRSLALLDRLGRGGALTKALLFQHVQALRRAGCHREALSELEKNSLLAASLEFVIPMAELYAAFGRERDAYALLEREARGTSANRQVAAAKLRELAVQLGDQHRAAAAETLLGSSDSVASTRNPATDWNKVISDMEFSTPTPEERFRAGRSFLLLADIPASLRKEQLGRLKRIAARTPSLAPELYVLRRELAEKFGSRGDLVKELLIEWNAGRGNYFAGETAIRLLLDLKRYEDLATVLNDYLVDAHFIEQAWDQIGRRLALERQYTLAVRVLSELRTRAPGDAARALLLAEVFWKTGSREMADLLVAPIKRVALFDPQKHTDLSEFYLKTDRPAEAKAQLLTAPSDMRSGAAWMRTADCFLIAEDFVETRDCIWRAMKTPPIVSARSVVDYYWQSGQLNRLDPHANEFNLPFRQFRDLQIQLAAKLVAEKKMDRAWLWIESIPSLPSDAQGRALLQSVEETDWNRAAALWQTAENSLWEARCAAAEFLVRRSRASDSPAESLKNLARAHEMHPGSFQIAQEYVARLVHDDPGAARRVLREVIESFAEPADRHAARQLLASLQASPSLPKGNQLE